MRESTVEGYLTTRVKALGGEVRKLAWVNRRHAPDRMVLLPRSQFYFLAEIKRPGKRASGGQGREITRLRRAGLRVYVLDSFAAVDAVLAQEGPQWW